MRSFERFTTNVALCVIITLCIPTLSLWGQQGGAPNYAPGNGPGSPPGYSPEQNVWVVTYRQALRIAAERRRLVLIHFWDDNCPPCRSVERNVFGMPDVQRAISMNYVPVRVNVSDDPTLAKQFNITRWPTDVVVTPEGIEVFRATSEQDPNRYIAFLDRVATSARVGMAPARDPNGSNLTNETNPTPPSARDDNGLIPRNYDDRQLANNAGGPNNNQNYQPGAPQQTNGPQGGAYQPTDNFGPANNDPRYAGGQNRWQQPPTGNPNGAPGSNPGQAAGQYNPGTTRNNPNDVGQGGQAQPQGNAFVGNQPPLPPNNPNQRFDPSLPNGSPGNDPRIQQNPTFPPNGGAPPGGVAGGPGNAPNMAVNPNGPPSIALDGFCPVTLTEQKKWKKGDQRFGAEHRFRTYVFASQVEQQKFMANPDKYSPMLSGYDPVQFADQGQFVFGKRQHGVTFGDQMYLFTDEASLQQFWKQPQKYVRTAQEAMRTSAAGNIQR